jgi:hypothetical protein
MATDAKRFEAKVEAFWLFLSMEKRLGRKEAVRIFNEIAKHGKGKKEFDHIGMTRREFEDGFLLGHSQMGFSDSDLYQCIKEHNRKFPKRRIGHTQSLETFKQHMRRLRNGRDELRRRKRSSRKIIFGDS